MTQKNYDTAEQAARQLFSQFQEGGTDGQAAGRLLTWFHTQTGSISWTDVNQVDHNGVCAVVLFHTMTLDRPHRGLEDLGLSKNEISDLPAPQANEAAA